VSGIPSGEQQTWDVVVVGSGGGGLTAAIRAAKSGLRTLLVEKTPFIGGTTALSGGQAWLPLNPLMTASGTPDRREDAELYLHGLIGEGFRADMVRAYVDASPRLVDFLHTETELRWGPIQYVDYKSELPGAVKTGRSLIALPYDARRLGADINLLRSPLPLTLAFGGMSFDQVDLYHLLNVTGSLKSFLHCARLISRYVRDLLFHSRSMRLVLGNALVGSLLRSARDAGVEFWVNAPATRLIKEGERVTAVEVCRDGTLVRLPVRRGVVLASGGFAHDPELRRRYLPFPERHQSVSLEANQGDAARMAMEIGGHIGEGTFNNFAGMPISVMRKTDGTAEKFFHARRAVAKPGVIAVNTEGCRFANEALPYNEFVHAMAAAGVAPGYFIADHRHLRRFGFGLVRPGPWIRPLGRYLESGYLMRADTIGELARQIGVPAANLEITVERFNEMARAGKDLDFGRGDSAYAWAGGDPSHKPHRNLGPIEKPPYYAIQFEPGNLGTFAGLVTDASARVLSASGRAIEGLYACGLDMLNPFSGNYPGGGGSIGPAMIFGFIAAEDIAARRAREAASNTAAQGIALATARVASQLASVGENTYSRRSSS
jgi:succinate dehydrogenase/fumarate reductase flavoprotein subunit